jgi:hypothetical protein
MHINVAYGAFTRVHFMKFKSGEMIKFSQSFLLAFQNAQFITIIYCHPTNCATAHQNFFLLFS